MNKRTERRDFLDKLVAGRQLSPAGANFVRKATDPFHDFEFDFRGMPDEDTSRVVIQQVDQTINIAAPGSGNWDCNISMIPDIATDTMQGVLLNSSGQLTSSLAGWSSTLGMLTAASVAANNPTYPTQATQTTSSNPTYSVVDYSPYLSDQRRLVALAFEVHNTTAELYRQGAVTVYRQPQTMEITEVLPNNAGDVIPLSFTVSRLPPGNQAQALLLPDSRQWNAADGCYVVGVCDVKNNRLTGGRWMGRLATPDDVGTFDPTAHAPALIGNYGVNNAYVATSSGGAVNQLLTVPYVTSTLKPLPFHSGGAYFTGLSPQTTLQINVRAIFEVCPAADDNVLTPLSRPSPDYDPAALELYQAVACQLPPGVPVGMNASGDFWDGVLDIVASAAPLVGMVFGPAGAAVGSAVSAGAKVAKAVKNASGEASPKKKIAAKPAPKKEQTASDRTQSGKFYGATGQKNVSRKQPL
jgi:hypothetical protein